MPRAGLSNSAVVGEACRLADEVGLDKVTLAALGERFGVAAPSLYKHVAGIESLHRQIAALAMSELADALGTAAVGKARGDALRAMATAYRQYAQSHPGRYAATVRAPAHASDDDLAAAEKLLDTVFSVLGGYGLSGDDAVDATRAVHAALHGFVALEAANAFGMPQSINRSYQRLVDGLDAALSEWNTDTTSRSQQSRRPAKGEVGRAPETKGASK